MQPPRLTYSSNTPEPDAPKPARPERPFRCHLVFEIRDRIADGTYDTDSKLDLAIEGLTDRPAA